MLADRRHSEAVELFRSAGDNVELHVLKKVENNNATKSPLNGFKGKDLHASFLLSFTLSLTTHISVCGQHKCSAAKLDWGQQVRSVNSGTFQEIVKKYVLIVKEDGGSSMSEGLLEASPR